MKRRPKAKTIAAYCAKAGRSFKDPAKLAEKLRKWVG
jgi:hypothetical protein